VRSPEAAFVRYSWAVVGCRGLFAALQLRTVAAKRLKRAETATEVIRKLLLVGERCSEPRPVVHWA
jgi:hypothetical protein